MIGVFSYNEIEFVFFVVYACIELFQRCMECMSQFVVLLQNICVNFIVGYFPSYINQFIADTVQHIPD